MESLLPLTQTSSAVGKNIVAGLNENQLLGLSALQACKPIAIQLEVETQLDRDSIGPWQAVISFGIR